MGEWIECAERMPKRGKPVYTWSEYVDGAVHVCPDLTPGWVKGNMVTHWQPIELPPPPRREPVYECPHCGCQRILPGHDGYTRIGSQLTHYWAECTNPECQARGKRETSRTVAMAHFRKDKEG